MYKSPREALLHLVPLGVAAGLLWAIVIVAVIYWQVTIRIIFAGGIIGCGLAIYLEFERYGKLARAYGALLALLFGVVALNVMWMLR